VENVERMTAGAVIIGDEPRVVLAVARSLERCGVPVDLIHSGSVAATSRSIRRNIRVASSDQSFHDYADAVLGALAQLTYPLVVPVSDNALHLVLERHDEVRRYATVAAPGIEPLRTVLDKEATMRHALACGVPIPATYDFPDEASFRGAHSSITYPVIAKPKNKAGPPARFKVMYFQSFDELALEFAQDPDFGRTYLLQEYVDGSGVGIGAFMRDGAAIAVAQHRRITELPPSGGVAVTAVSELVDPQLADYAVRLLRTIGWDGLAMVEFKCSANGRTALMEINGRAWGSIALAIASGVDFPRYLWMSYAGAPLNTLLPAAKDQVRFSWSAGGLARLEMVLIDPAIPPIGFVRELRSFFEHLLDPRGHPVFRILDPLPGVLELTQVARGSARRIAKAAISRFVPRRVLTVLSNARTLPAPARRVYVGRSLWRSAGFRRRPPRRRIRSVLFVCHGNIMRSAFAAATLRAALTSSTVDVDSAGVAARVGRPADDDAMRVADELGVSLARHRAKPVTRELINSAELIVVMDWRNEALLLEAHPDARRRVAFLGAFAPDADEGEMIADPYRAPRPVVEECFTRIARAVHELARYYQLDTVGSERPPSAG
jgi:predicted ATP-grasp superfamily ATP-dependent carboligase/protein-tyrosine-phosphatase